MAEADLQKVADMIRYLRLLGDDQIDRLIAYLRNPPVSTEPSLPV